MYSARGDAQRVITYTHDVKTRAGYHTNEKVTSGMVDATAQTGTDSKTQSDTKPSVAEKKGDVGV